MPPTSSSTSPRVSVDWAAVRDRIDRASEAAQSPSDAPEKVAALLAKRAAALAPALTPLGRETEEGLDVVAFELGGQMFALEASLVREAVLLRGLTRLPGLPEFIRGIVNIRSRVVPAVDLRAVLQLPAASAPEEEKLLVVTCDDVELGLIVERVAGLRRLTGALRREVAGLDEKYLRGLADDGTLVLSLPALVPDLIVDDGPVG